jgi:hypothetical protein
MKNITILLVTLFAITIIFAQEIPREGLVGYWKLDEGQGETTADASDFGATGTLEGTVDWVDGYIGKALEFDGEDGYVDCGAGSGQFDIDDAITLSVWVNQWDLGNSEHNPWFGKGDHSYQIKHQQGNNYRFIVYTDDWYSASVPVDESHMYEWHHFAGTYDLEFIRLYVDGVLVDSLEHDKLIALSEHPVCMAWNSDETAAGRYFAGQLDEAMIYNVVLSDDQIKQLYDIKSGVMQERTLANSFKLQQNYPNPFNPVTTISYTIPAYLPVTLKVYNMLGEEIGTLVDEQQNIGTYSVSFDGSRLPSGIYVYKIQAGERLMEMKKMILIK